MKEEFQHPVFVFVKLNISSNIPIIIIEELFSLYGLDKNKFSIFHIVDKENNKTVVFDYPVEFTKEECLDFMNKVKPSLDKLDIMFSDKTIKQIARNLKDNN